MRNSRNYPPAVWAPSRSSPNIGNVELAPEVLEGLKRYDTGTLANAIERLYSDKPSPDSESADVRGLLRAH